MQVGARVDEWGAGGGGGCARVSEETHRSTQAGGTEQR